jgi:hypothetical protein
MALGPIEVLVVGFPGSEFNGAILPALEDLMDKEIVSIIDCVLITKNDDDSIDVIEIEEVDSNSDAARLTALIDDGPDLLSDEDLDEFAAALAPGDSAAALVFEHTWAKPFRDALVGSGGVMVANVRIPGLVVDEVLAAMEEEE